MRIQSIRVLNLLNVDVHLNIGKNWLEKVVHMSTQRNRSILLMLRFLRFYNLFQFFLLLFFNVFGIVIMVNQTLDQLQFQSRASLSQIKVRIPIRLKFKLCAASIEWSSQRMFCSWDGKTSSTSATFAS